MPKHCEVVVYPENGWQESSIIAVIEKHKSVCKYAFIFHHLDEAKPHYHIYLNFGQTNEEFKYIAKWFKTETEKVERIKSDLYFVLNYYLHNEEFDKHQYSTDDIIANFNVKEYLEKQKRKQTLNTIIKKCASGMITPLNFHSYIDPITFSKHETEIRRAWEYATHSRTIASKEFRSCHVIWIYGNGGTGKTTMCKLCADEQNLPAYTTAGGKDPFSHYSGQPFVILDDIRPNEPFTFAELLKVLDPNNVSAVHSRYRNKLLFCSYIMITTTMSPQYFVKECLTNSIDDPGQLYRRIEEVWDMSKDDIEISTYDSNLSAFKVEKTIQNPIPNYIKTLPAFTKLDGASLINNLNMKYATN